MPNLFRTIRPITVDEIQEKARVHGFQLTDDELKVMEATINESLEMYERLEELPNPEPSVAYPNRNRGWKPTDDDDPYNAFVTRCTIDGSPDGRLAGYEIGIKDNIAVAGIRMTAGSKLIEGYVPTTDATVVTRLLEEGGTITGKLNMTSLASDGGGSETAIGPVLNPHDTEHLAGGSSSGAGAAVTAEMVDIALGADQGGSIRIPASWCGCVGLKPTHGLVPYTGIMELDPTIDHVGPLARTVEDCARTLEVIAGQDPLDPRQSDVDVPDVTSSLTAEPGDLQIGVLEDSFGLDESEAEVDETVRGALSAFGRSGAELVDVSTSWHVDGLYILDAIAITGMTNLMHNDGLSHAVGGFYDLQLANTFGKARRVQAKEFPPMLKQLLIVGEYLSDEYRNQYYAKAQNLRRPLTEAYDELLTDVDVIAMPTLPQTAFRYEPEQTLKSFMQRSFSMRANCAPFNATGHPAITVPCGTVGGLPVGLQFVGDRFDDETVLQAAHSFEQSVDRE